MSYAAPLATCVLRWPFCRAVDHDLAGVILDEAARIAAAELARLDAPATVIEAWNWASMGLALGPLLDARRDRAVGSRGPSAHWLVPWAWGGAEGRTQFSRTYS
jgi:hypothetical protein